METCVICDELAGGKVKVQQVWAVPAQVQSCLVSDLLAAREDEFVDEMTVLGKDPTASKQYQTTIMYASKHLGSSSVE